MISTHNTAQSTMVDSLIDAARQPFLDLAADIHGSLVYLDAGAAEVAELTLGPAFLLGRCMAAADGVRYAWFAGAASITLYDVWMWFLVLCLPDQA